MAFQAEKRISLLEISAEVQKTQLENQTKFLADFRFELMKRLDVSDLKLQEVHSCTNEILLHNARTDLELEQVKKDISNLRRWKNGLVNSALASSLAAGAFWIKHKFYNGGG